MIVGSLAGPLISGGGFCAGTEEAVEHQRISSTAYTFSAALPAMLATTASETITMLQTNPEILHACRENIKTMWAQLDPRSEWVVCTSAPENPMMVLVFKKDLLVQRRWSVEEQEMILQDVVDEVSLTYPSIPCILCSPLPPPPPPTHHFLLAILLSSSICPPLTARAVSRLLTAVLISHSAWRMASWLPESNACPGLHPPLNTSSTNLDLL